MDKKGRVSIFIPIVIYVILSSMLTINRHYTFRSCALDFGWFIQAFWNTVHGGGILSNTPQRTIYGIYTHFGIHFSPILLCIVPIYAIFPRPETLLVLQSLFLGIGAYPLYLLSKRILQDETYSRALIMVYLMNSYLHGINSFDFHATPFAVPFFFLVAYYFENKEYTKSLIASIPIILTKEDAGLGLIGIGLFYLFRTKSVLKLSTYYDIVTRLTKKELTKNEKYAIILVIIGFLFSMLGLKVIVPYFAQGHHYTFEGYFTGLCPNLIPQKVAYFLIFQLTLGLLLFLKPKYMILLTTIPWLESLLSCNPNQSRIGFQYPYIILPLSFIGAIYILKEIKDRQYTMLILKISLVVGIIASLLTTPFLPPINDTMDNPLIFRAEYEPITSHHKLLSEITDVLNNCSCSILTQNDIFPHLANRNNTYLIWSDMISKNCTYLTDVLKIDIILIDSNLIWGRYNTILLPKDFKKCYIRIYENDGIEIYVRKDKLNDIEIQKIIKKIKDIDTP